MLTKQKFNFEPRWFAVIIFFISGVFIGGFILFIWIFNGGRLYGIQKIHSSSSKYKFINPLLAVEQEKSVDFFANLSLQNKFTGIIDKYEKNKDIKGATVYFRDLEPGRWVNINGSLKFSAGKLLKVPMMIAYFKQAETNPTILQKKLVYTVNTGNIAPANQADLHNGQSYTIEELIKNMIIIDDDNSANILFDNIDKPALNEVFADLGISYKEDKESEDFLTAQQYGLFFRVLYNATYLNREFSEKSLDILSQTPNTDGISIGLPNDLTIADKYRTRIFGNGLQESHDCGIIYYPNHPYLMCVMGIGKDTTVINSMFKELSQAAYNDMVEKYKN